MVSLLQGSRDALSRYWTGFRRTFTYRGARVMTYIPSRHVEEIKGLLKKILDNQEAEKQQEKKMAVGLDQLTTDVTTLQTTLNTGLGDLETEVANLKAQVAAGQTPDFTAIDTIINSMNTQVASADPGAQGTTAAAVKS